MIFRDFRLQGSMPLGALSDQFTCSRFACFSMDNNFFLYYRSTDDNHIRHNYQHFGLVFI